MAARTIVYAKVVLPAGGKPALRDGAVLVEDGRIKEVGPQARFARLRKKAEAIDASRFTVMPGMINLHSHLDSDCSADFLTSTILMAEQTSVLLAVDNARRALAAGITTVRDLGNKYGVSIALRDAIGRGWLTGPRILSAGKVLCMTGGHAWFIGDESDGPDEIRKSVRQNLKRGADWIKVIATGGVLSPGVEVGSAQLDPDELEMAVREAHKAGRRVAAHAIGNGGIKNALRAGVDTIEHGCYLDDEAIALFKKTNAVLVATLCAPHFLLENIDKIPAYAARKTKEVHAAHRESFKRALRKGVTIAAGTDAGTPFNYQESFATELELMVGLGMDAEAAFESCTSGAARVLGLERETGSLEAGKSADLIMVEGDPRKDISATKRVRGVMIRGTMVARA